MEAARLGESFRRILTGFLEPIAPDPVAYGVLRAAGDENVRSQELAPLLASDARYRRYLFAQTFLSERMSAWESEEPEGEAARDRIFLDRILGLLGKRPVRNLIACAHVGRIAGDAAGETGSDGEKISVTPSRVIPFALKAEKTCQDRSWIQPEAAFSAGLHYDWLAALSEKRKGPAEEKSAVEAAFKEGMAVACVAYELGQRIKEARLGKSIFAAGLLLPAGKALMSFLFPASLSERSWARFAKSCDEAGSHAFDRYRYGEARVFGITHAELGALLASFGALLRTLERPIGFYPDPWRLRTENPDQYQLSVLLSVSARIARTGDKGVPLEPYQEQWLAANRVTADTLKSVAKAAQDRPR